MFIFFRSLFKKKTMIEIFVVAFFIDYFGKRVVVACNEINLVQQ